MQLLNQQVDWLSKQIDALKETKPEKLITILDNRIEVTNREISRLNKDREANLALVEEKERERNILLAEVKRLKERSECIHCAAALTAFSDEEGYTFRHFACGYGTGLLSHPCPKDPEFPKFEEYDLEMEFEYDVDAGKPSWHCYAVPKTERAKGLTLSGVGHSEDEARKKCFGLYLLHKDRGGFLRSDDATINRT